MTARRVPAKYTTLWLCVTALLMACNIVLSSFGIPVPGGHLYLNDVVIDYAALLLDPFAAFLVGGVGSFLGDFFFYPTPMFVSLVTHGLQAVVISLCAHSFRGNTAASESQSRVTPGCVLGVVLGAIIMVVGYSLGRAFIYSTPQTALVKLPYQILQAGVGAIFSLILYHRIPLSQLSEHD